MKVVPCIWMCVGVTRWQTRERVIAQSYVTSWPLHVKQHAVQCQWLQQRYACLDVCLTVPTISLKRFSLLGLHPVSPAWGNSGIQWKDHQFWQLVADFLRMSLQRNLWHSHHTNTCISFYYVLTTHNLFTLQSPKYYNLLHILFLHLPVRYFMS